MATKQLIHESNQLSHAQQYVQMVEFIQAMDNVAHNMAIERGISSGLIGDRNRDRITPLNQQRQRVDKHVSNLYQYLENSDFRYFSTLVNDQIAELQEALKRVGTIRLRVNYGGQSEDLLSDVFDYYSEINALSLRITSGLIDQVAQLALVNEFNTLLSLLWIKERAGQERGRLNHYFSSGELSTKSRVEINHYIHDQKLKEDDFRTLATPAQRRLFEARVHGDAVDYVVQVRNSFLLRMKKRELLGVIESIIGYGGGIHKFKNYLFHDDETLHQEFYSFYDHSIEVLDRYSSLEAVDVYELTQLEIIEQSINAYYNGVETVISTGERKPLLGLESAAAIEALDQLSKYTRVDPLVWFNNTSERIGLINSVVDQVKKDLQGVVLKNLDEVEKEFNFYQAFILIIVVATLWALYLWYRLLRNVRRTVEVIHNVEDDGDLSQRIPVDSRDEIGQIGSALNSLFSVQQQAIRDAIRVSAAVAEGHFEQRIDQPYRGDMEALKEGINGSADRVEYYTYAKDEFMAAMSHELRTPLTTIIGNCEFLAERLQKDENRELLHAIEVAGHNQLALVNDILDMSKIESGKFTIDEHPYNLTALLKDIEDIFSIRMRDAGLHFEVIQQEKPKFQLIGDSQRVSQILINLLGNAIKFTEKGAVTLTVYASGGELHFAVKDTGVGMSFEVQDSLFQRFEQADRSISRRYGGSGLGLFISDNLAELMGGTIEVFSREGDGSTFMLNLPHKQNDQPVEEGVDSNRKMEQILVDRFAGTVLIAEDTPELQQLERRLLQSAGVDVVIANDGKEAVELATAQPFDLIFMDMQMPVMDGIEATRTLRMAGNRTPIVALTANVMQKHRDAFNQAGCNHFLAKPIEKQQLWQVLKQYLPPEQSAPAASARAFVDEEVDEEVDDELMALFMESATNNKRQLMEALSEKDWEKVRETAHTIKGSAASFGYPDLSKVAEVVQMNIDEKRLEQVSEQTMDLIIEMGKVLS